ncbi:Uma2 family endonuclease [Hymenobacter endophyticus]|uniref:Uma2 family endonuclease n=1 Tax=Hymenobacter endophyticus TaxID=3076335 RepID=A0ABU3TMF4_9BACT|nr:Uma2 family endonuclease [Hymenobacter endophyticus]MDU0372551.1 Uma2 family endonuclease [Hymenobacter endophyticus]
MEQDKLPVQYTVEEYLTLEENSEIRHEFYQGEIFAMSGVSLPHNRIIGNGYRALGDRLNPAQCEVFLDGAQLKVDATCFLYPDLTISCHPDDLAADRILAHPSVVFEVLSPSSADYDRTSKLRLYQQLPSLRHYALVRQDYCWVECLTRQPELAGTENEWTLQVYDKLTDELHLSALSIRVPLTELYARVKLEQPPQIRLR